MEETVDKKRIAMEETYEKLFSRMEKRSRKVKSIKSIEFEVIGSSATKIVVTLFNRTRTESPIPAWCWEAENKALTMYYVTRILVPRLTGMDPLHQDAVDKILDEAVEELDFKEYEKVARNVNWAMSAAVCKAGAHCKKTSLYQYIHQLAIDKDEEFHSFPGTPTPSFSVTNGGSWPKKRLADQHLVVIPFEPYSFNEAISVLGKIYDEYFADPAAENDAENEGGLYTPNTMHIRRCVESLNKIIEKLGYQDKVKMGVNIGASKLYTNDKTYRVNISDENSKSSAGTSADELYEAYFSMKRGLGFCYFEDVFHMDHGDYAYKLPGMLHNRIVVMEFDPWIDGMNKALEKNICNSIHLKVGEIGSVTKSIEFVSLANFCEWKIILPSHDSCETSDPFLADFGFGLGLEQVKVGVSCITTNACNVCNRFHEIEIEDDKLLRQYSVCGLHGY